MCEGGGHGGERDRDVFYYTYILYYTYIYIGKR
jgi:hypothetical protein